MKRVFIGFILPGVLALLLFSCDSGEYQKKAKAEEVAVQQVDPETLVGSESKLMLDYLNELGDYVNSRNFPSLIKAESVYEGLENNQLILDIRPAEQFSTGHIKGAVRIDFSALPDYFQSEIVPFEFNRIIIVSADGQASSYATCLLRLMGYGNVYSMRWGMSGWHSDFAKNHWYKAIGSAHEDQLVNDVFEKAPPQQLPGLATGKTTGEEILLARVNTLFRQGLDLAHISADEVFEAPGNYYIMNYIRRDKYEAGHIPGAIRYKPQATLGIVPAMSTIAQDKAAVVYCDTGHNSGFATAYLRLFGYNAQTLIYGNNAFMHDKMMKERATLSWLPFTKEEIGEYAYVK